MKIMEKKTDARFDKVGLTIGLRKIGVPAYTTANGIVLDVDSFARIPAYQMPHMVFMNRDWLLEDRNGIPARFNVDRMITEQVAPKVRFIGDDRRKKFTFLNTYIAIKIWELWGNPMTAEILMDDSGSEGILLQAGEWELDEE